ADAAHVGGEMIDLVDSLGDTQALVIAAQIRNHEFVGRSRLVFGMFEVGAANEVPEPDKVLDQVMSDKSASSGNECRFPVAHFRVSLALSSIPARQSRKVRQLLAMILATAFRDPDWNEVVTPNGCSRRNNAERAGFARSVREEAPVGFEPVALHIVAE